jgi:excisionase family DNA binding protein
MDTNVNAYTVKSFCAAFGVGKTTLYQLRKAGAIRVRKLGSKTLIPAAEAERWFASLPTIGARHER